MPKAVAAFSLHIADTLLNVSDCLLVSNCLAVRLSVCLSVSPSISLSICLSVRPSVCLSICLSGCPSVCLSVRLSVYVKNHDYGDVSAGAQQGRLTMSVSIKRSGEIKCLSLFSALSSNCRVMASVMVVDAPGFRNPAHCGRSSGATFEDLCHNYVQERLQLLFHDTVFTSKQDLYAQVCSFQQLIYRWLGVLASES